MKFKLLLIFFMWHWSWSKDDRFLYIILWTFYVEYLSYFGFIDNTEWRKKWNKKKWVSILLSLSNSVHFFFFWTFLTFDICFIPTDPFLKHLQSGSNLFLIRIFDCFSLDFFILASLKSFLSHSYPVFTIYIYNRFCCSGKPTVKIKWNEGMEKYRDLTWELKKVVGNEVGYNTNSNWCIWNCPQRLRKENGGIGYQTKNQALPDNCIIKIR